MPQWDHRDQRPAVYLPRKFYHSIEVSIVARTSIEPAGLRTVVERELSAVSRDLPLDWMDLDELVAATIAPTRFVLLLLSIFSAMAVVLAAIGLYGVLAEAVAQRTREFGVRMAFGARTTDVLKAVLRRGLVIATTGTALGVGGALALGGLLEHHLFRVAPTDGVSAGLVLFVAALASSVPAVRAAHVDPIVALHTD